MVEIIAGIAVGVGASMAMNATVNDIVNSEREGLSAITDEVIANNLTPQEEDIFSKYRELEEGVEIIKRNENRVRKGMIDDMEREHGYSAQISKLVDEKNRAVANLRSEMKIDELVQEAQNRARTDIQAYDEANGISSGIAECRKAIEAAKSEYDHSKTMIDLFDKSDNADAMKKAAKKIRNQKIAEQEQKIHSLKETLEAEKTRVNGELAKQTADIRKSYDAAKRTMESKYDATIGEIRADRQEAVSKIDYDIIHSRSDSEVDMREDLRLYKSKVEDIETRVEKKLVDEAAKMSRTDLLAAYLRRKGWSKPKVIVVASIPAVPFVYAGVKYVKKVAEVVSKL